MLKIFPDPIRKLPLADIPIQGLKAYLSQGDRHQILFMKFAEDVEIPEHSHESQWGVVLAGKIELTIGGERQTYKKGEHYFIPAGMAHAANIHAGYVDITFFNQPDRYQKQVK
ncbi:MAG: cupin domain-containing protein [Anaerolineales bacterium]|jgi:quercetin dioxygenase-like cupin family protein